MMDPDTFGARKTGRLVAIAGIPGATHAFVPDRLPKTWEIPPGLWPLVRDARASVAKLDGIGRYLPNPQLLLSPLQYREAQISSELEGTIANPRQLLLFDMDSSAREVDDADQEALQEVANYKRALDYHFEVRDSLPISLRLIRMLHKKLLTGVRGGSARPGEFRTVAVQIGRPARFVPPPPPEIVPLLDDLEKRIHNKQPMTADPLVDAFIIHYQFEAIHPFQDGNGRVGRLLLAIMLAAGCDLDHNWLYMSEFFDAHRDEYFERLLRVSTDGDWEGWIKFCLEGTVAQADGTFERSNALLQLLEDFRERIRRSSGSYGSARLVSIVEGLFELPVLDIPRTGKKFAVTYPTARSDVQKLEEVGILRELPGTRPKVFFSEEIVDLIFERA